MLLLSESLPYHPSHTLQVSACTLSLYCARENLLPQLSPKNHHYNNVWWKAVFAVMSNGDTRITKESVQGEL